jgi:hypothetical protein
VEWSFADLQHRSLRDIGAEFWIELSHVVGKKGASVPDSGNRDISETGIEKVGVNGVPAFTSAFCRELHVRGQNTDLVFLSESLYSPL